MTTGNTTKRIGSNRTVYDRYAGTNITYFVGSQVQRSWTGQDWPKTKPVRPVPEERSPGLGALSRPPTRARREEHTYSCSISKTTTSLCYARQKSNPSMFRTSNAWAQPNVSLLPLSSDIATSALGKLRTRVAGSDFNAGIFLAEGRESLAMIELAATKVVSTLRLIKRGRIGEASRVLTGQGSTRRIKKYDDPNWIDDVPFSKREAAIRQYDRDISSSWLELQYGWLPLLSDAEAGAKFLAHQFSVPLQKRIVVRAFRSTTKPIPSTSPTDFVFNDSEVWESRQIIAYLREKSVPSLLGLTDPASVAWELVPWSFVVDWFVPIGNYLSARGLAQSLRGDYVVTTLRRVRTGKLALKPSNGTNFASQWYLSGGEGAVKFEVVSVLREVTSSLTVPLPEVKPLSEVYSWRRAANAVSLLDQLRPR